MKIGLDTNVFIAIMNKEPNHIACKKILDQIQTNQIHERTSPPFTAYLSTLVVAEILVGLYKKKELTQIHEFLNSIKLYFQIIPLSLEIANDAAQLRGEFNIKLPDAIISMSYHQAKIDYFITNDIELNRKLSFKVIKPEEFVLQNIQK